MSAPAPLRPCTALVLAAQRAGVVNPLAQAAGVSHKCLVPIDGAPLIAHVVAVLAGVPALRRIRISVEQELHAPLQERLAPLCVGGPALEFTLPSPSIVDSLLATAGTTDGPLMITTADNVLLTRESFEATLAALGSADAVVNLARAEAVRAVHPDAQRRFYLFRDGAFANCNLYAIAGPHAFGAFEVFREGGQFMKNPRRLVRAFGLFNILLFRLRLLSIRGVERRLSRRLRARVKVLVPADGTQAVDVDNQRTFAVAEMVLRRRAAA